MQKPLSSWLLLLLIGTIWGSSFFLIKTGLLVFEDTQVAAMRMALAWLATLPFLIGRMRQITKQQWFTLLWVGLLGNGIPAFLFATAQTQLESSLTGMLNSLVPIFTLIFGLLFFGSTTWTRQVIGLIIGFIGAVLLMVMPAGIHHFNPYAILVIAAGSCYALNANIVRHYLPTLSSTLITAGAFFWAGPLCLVYLLTTDFTSRFTHEMAWISFSAIAVLSVVGTAIAVVLFNKLIQTCGPLFASMVTYIVPVVAILWGVLDGERVSAWSLAGVVIILLGVYLANKPPEKRP